MAKKKVTIKKTKRPPPPPPSPKAADRLAELPDELMQRARTIWLAGLGALATVEQEGTAFYADLVERGEAWEQGRQQQLRAALSRAEEQVEDAEEEAEAAVRGWAGASVQALAQTQEQLAERLDGLIEAALQRTGIPTRDELHDLNAKIERLTEKVDALSSALHRRRR